MKILIHSNGPNVPTGYGVQAGMLGQRLRTAGHDVAFSVYYGHQTGIGSWDGFPLLPCSGESYGNDIIHEHAYRWFGGDKLGGWIITLMDVFGIVNPVLNEFNVAAWTPVDHWPTPPAVQEFFTRTGAVPIAMSEYAMKLLKERGLDPLYAPLAVDTNIFKPVENAKEVCGAPEDKFIVMMNGMNKGAYHHRKGFPEAFYAFGQFAKNHPDALLYVHAEQWGPYAGGINLVQLAMSRGIPEHQLKFCDQYAYRCGFITQENLAAAYSAADVLLQPSRGEGFCVPLIEAQACGTPVIVTDFSAQPELVGAGWKVHGTPEWDAAMESDYLKADIPELIQRLEQSYEERGDEGNRQAAIMKAREYDVNTVFEKYWQPILAKLAPSAPIPLDRPRIPEDSAAVAVIVPGYRRPGNVQPLVESFEKNGTDANLYFVCDEDDEDEIHAVKESGANLLISTRGSSFAQKVNSGFEQTTEPWVFVCGDDVKFHGGWVHAARQLSDRFDVIGSNDSSTGEGNPRVAAGAHADHFFIRRAYVEEYGGCLGDLVCHEGYRHFYSDVETIELAKARGVFTPCLDSIVEHLHPDLGKATVDEVYKEGWSARAADEKEWRKRAPMVAMQSESLAKVRSE